MTFRVCCIKTTLAVTVTLLTVACAANGPRNSCEASQDGQGSKGTRMLTRTTKARQSSIEADTYEMEEHEPSPRRRQAVKYMQTTHQQTSNQDKHTQTNRQTNNQTNTHQPTNHTGVVRVPTVPTDNPLGAVFVPMSSDELLWETDFLSESTDGAEWRQTSKCIEEIIPNFATAAFLMVLFSIGVAATYLACAAAAFRFPLQQKTNLMPQMHMPALDGIRTLIVTHVIAYHYLHIPYPFHNGWMTPLIGFSMQFLYVLSGFVNCQTTMRLGDQLDMRSSLFGIIRRQMRLFPMYYLGLYWMSAYAFLVPSAQHAFLAWPIDALGIQSAVAVYICGSQGHRYSIAFNGNLPAWFASNLMLISLLFPLLYNWRPRSRGLVFVSLTFLVVVAPFCVAMSSPHLYRLGIQTYAFMPIRLLEFGAGMLAAQLCSCLPRTCLSWAGWGCVFDASLILSVALPVAFKNGYVKLHTPLTPSTFNLSISVMLCLSARGASEATAVAGSTGCLIRVLALRPLTLLAEYSYAAYILGHPVVLLMLTILHSINYHLEDHHLFVFRLLLSVMPWIIGAAATHLIDLPLRRWIDKQIHARNLPKHQLSNPR